MMRKYFNETLHWLHLALFKPISLDAEADRLSKRQGLIIYFKVLPVQMAILLAEVALVGLWSRSAGHSFKWSEGFVGSATFGLFVALLFGLVIRLVVELRVVLVLGQVVELVAGLVVWPGVGLGYGLVFSNDPRLIIGLVDGLMVRLVAGMVVGLVAGLVVGLAGDRLLKLLGTGWWLVFTVSYLLVVLFPKLPDFSPYFNVGFFLAFLFAYLRPFYLVPYALQFWRSRKSAEPFTLFRNSPVYWDEAIAMPFPFLSDWLVELNAIDPASGMNEIAKVARLPYQRKAAQRALVSILVQEIHQADSIEKIASAPKFLAILPSDARHLPNELAYAARHVGRVAEIASDYLARATPVGQMNAVTELRSAIAWFRDAMILVKPPVGRAFRSAATYWLEIADAEEVECRKRIAVEPIPNPFVVGNPLKVRDKHLFKGRKDIIVAIEENIINPTQRPALLLYGRRRTGKTSTLLNLPNLLRSKFVPVFIDCQDAKWREGDATFCYHLVASIHDALNQRSLVETNRRPQLERFERYAFTRLGEYLDQIEEASRAANKQILLTFDEYEKLEDGISASRVTTEVLNELRTIVQHRERIVVLFSGSHRFEEMKAINWSDFLINVKTLELSFLAPKDARELITEPVPLLQYEPGIIEQIIELTHCQPYLLQAVASDLVNYLNSEGRMLATAADLEVAVEKVLVTVQSYFVYTWTGDCSEAEREVLRMIATGNAHGHTLADHHASLQSLCHKEILERQQSGYRFSIELFRRWILKNQTTQPFAAGDLSEPAELEYTVS